MAIRKLIRRIEHFYSIIYILKVIQQNMDDLIKIVTSKIEYDILYLYNIHIKY